MNTTITGTPDEFVLKSHITKVPAVIIIFMSLLALFIFTTPFIVIIFTGFSPGIIFGILLCSFISFRFVRMILWNLYGVETITYKNRTLTKICDYKYFQTKPDELTGKIRQITMGSEHTIESENSVLDASKDNLFVTLGFIIEDKEVITTLPVKISMAKRFFKIK